MQEKAHTHQHRYDLMDERTRAAALEREAYAERIDPTTCLCWFHYVDVSDPYGERPDPTRETNSGRCYFVEDPEEPGPLLQERHFRLLHPNIPDAEWRALMHAAERRWYDLNPEIKDLQQKFIDNYPVARLFGWPFP